MTRIKKYRGGPARSAADPQMDIGCLMVSVPVFFDESEWIPQPRDWRSNAVQGITYDLSDGKGRRIYEQCLAKATASGF